MMCLPSYRLGNRAGVLLTSALLIAGVCVQAETPEQLMKEADAHDTKLEASQALDDYLKLEQLQPNNADVLVRIARQYRHLMADAKSAGEKQRLGATALEYGRRAAALAPMNSDAQLSCAISYGKMLPLQSNKEQVACSKLIKEGAEKAIRLNSNNDLAWHILGRWHRGVASVGAVKKALASMIYDKLPDATNEEAAECLEKAAKLNPNRLMHQIELGRTYAQMGRTEEARRVLKRGLAMPSVEKDDAAMKEAGRETLASLN
ncbi:hypothetical protein [Verrucomicrobium spinosum]|uniref:hypothetical protein n=1 Tax=Verrucomicrobium spinosum TaxID=2736 RepID=UPI00031A6625|nr:hypothetical protein [Verrucomicrobium spinosum]